MSALVAGKWSYDIIANFERSEYQFAPKRECKKNHVENYYMKIIIQV